MELDFTERALIGAVFYDSMDGKLDNAAAAMMLGQVLVAKASQELGVIPPTSGLPVNYRPPTVNR